MRVSLRSEFKVMTDTFGGLALIIVSTLWIIRAIIKGPPELPRPVPPSDEVVDEAFWDVVTGDAASTLDTEWWLRNQRDAS